MQIDLIAGARPNVMKIAPIIEAGEKAKQEGKDINSKSSCLKVFSPCQVQRQYLSKART